MRPAMVLFCSLEPNEKVERRMFDSMEVAIASRWFDCVRIYVEDIDIKGEREKYAKVVPSIIFLDGSGREVTRLAGSGVSAPVVYSAMQKASAGDFKKPLPALVERYSAFLKRFDKVQGQVANLEAEVVEDLAHVAKHDCASGRRSLKEHEDELKPLQVEREKLLEEEKTLLKPELKSKPAGSPGISSN